MNNGKFFGLALLVSLSTNVCHAGRYSGIGKSIKQYLPVPPGAVHNPRVTREYSESVKVSEGLFEAAEAALRGGDVAKAKSLREQAMGAHRKYLD